MGVVERVKKALSIDDEGVNGRTPPKPKGRKGVFSAEGARKKIRGRKKSIDEALKKATGG